MQFTTKIPITPSEHAIEYASRIISLGSCFAENMGAQWDYFKFQHLTNPFGIIFNPVAIEKLIYRAVHKIEFTEKDIFFHNELWHCFEVHSALSQTDPKLLLESLNKKLHHFRVELLAASHMICTYGTAWVYIQKASHEIVANCHKVSQNQFDKEILSVETVFQSMRNTIDLMQQINPTCAFIFTISPVRHIKDGFVENQRSKAHLITALHEIMDNQSGAVNYFPSYEIMMDELRDYRFYDEDLLHPNKIALRYIWERFCESTLAPSTFPIMQEVAQIQKGMAHRPFNPNAASHQQFLQTLAKKSAQLKNQFPFMEF